METEYEITKDDKSLNHFQQVFKTARKLKDQRIIDRIMDKKRMEKMPWHRKLEIQKKTRQSPFVDNPVNHSIVRGIN